MPDGLFISVLNMSFVASAIILFVLIARMILKKAPKVFSYALWSVVLFRLLCPVSFESAIGVLPGTLAPIPQDIAYQAHPRINTGVHIIDNSINPILPAPTEAMASINPLQVWTTIGSYIWLLGMAIMIVYSTVHLLKLKRKLIGATPLRDRIYLVDHIPSPFVIGLVKPKIYLPSTLSGAEQRFILAHEVHHIKRLDHVTRLLSFIALAIHWFNPLVWLAFILSGKDMEMSCDEAVMRKMDCDIRVAYSQALLRFATRRRAIATSPLAFGEGETKGRVKNVMTYKKPVIGTVIVLTLLVVGVVLAFGTHAKAVPIPIDQAHDRAVISVLHSERERYLMGECFGEGHILLGTEQEGSMTKIYALTMVGQYGFQNDHFVKVSGSGIIPAVITSSSTGDVYIEYPQDGEGYTASVQKMFPEAYHSRILDGGEQRERDYASLQEQERAYARAYLEKIGRNAEIGTYRDFEHRLLTEVGVSVEVSNALEVFYKQHDRYPYFIGTQEFIEEGVRMVYEMRYHKNQDEIQFIKYTYDTKETVESFTVNVKTGEGIEAPH